MTELHPDVAALAPLLGTWSGDGAGEYPTIASFGYHEEITFGHVGKPFLTYGQRTTASDDGRPLHAEVGYCAGRAPIVSSSCWPTRRGSPRSRRVRSPGRRDHDGADGYGGGAHGERQRRSAVARSIRVDGDELTYEVTMAAVGQPMQHHLAATLRRRPS